MVLREGHVLWVGCVTGIESIPNTSSQERFLTPSKHEGSSTRCHHNLTRSFHAGPACMLGAWTPCKDEQGKVTLP